MATDEMQDAVMRAPELVAFEQTVGVAHEIAIGEEQKLDQIEHRFGVLALGLRPDRALQSSFHANAPEIKSVLLTCFRQSAARQASSGNSAECAG